MYLELCHFFFFGISFEGTVPNWIWLGGKPLPYQMHFSAKPLPCPNALPLLRGLGLQVQVQLMGSGG